MSTVFVGRHILFPMPRLQEEIKWQKQECSGIIKERVIDRSIFRLMKEGKKTICVLLFIWDVNRTNISVTKCFQNGYKQ